MKSVSKKHTVPEKEKRIEIKCIDDTIMITYTQAALIPLLNDILTLEYSCPYTQNRSTNKTVPMRFDAITFKRVLSYIKEVQKYNPNESLKFDGADHSRFLETPIGYEYIQTLDKYTLISMLSISAYLRLRSFNSAICKAIACILDKAPIEELECFFESEDDTDPEDNIDDSKDPIDIL